MQSDVKISMSVDEAQIVIESLRTELGFARFNSRARAATGAERAEAGRRVLKITKMLEGLHADVPEAPRDPLTTDHLLGAALTDPVTI